MQKENYWNIIIVIIIILKALCTLYAGTYVQYI